MSKDNRQTAERLDIALERIAAEKVARTGHLDLGNLGLTRPPPGLSELDWLEGLSLGQFLGDNSNRIESIAAWLRGLPRLRVLECSGAKLHDLTPLAGLSALQFLNCWGTRLTDLPESVIELPNLKKLIINFQPGLGHIPAEVLSQSLGDNCLSRLRAHLADLDAGAAPLRDLKVIVLGNGRIGKTQLCRRLRGEEFEPDADSTHGISVTSVELVMPEDEEDAVLNLWDFGGQDIHPFRSENPGILSQSPERGNS